MADQLIALLGGYGAVGATTARRLASKGHTVRIGGRSPERARTLATELAGTEIAGTEIDISYVDSSDPASLSGFCDDAHVVVNCAGPSFQVLDDVARVAGSVGAHYVDVAGDLPAYRNLSTQDGFFTAATALFSAGLMPGLTGLLPRLFPQPVDRLHTYVGGAVHMTPASAADILLAEGPDFGEPMACWANGRVVSRALSPMRRERLAGFPEPVDAMPFLPTESQRLAARFNLTQSRFYSVYASESIPTALAMAWADDDADRQDHVASLMDAAVADLADRAPYYVLSFYAYQADESTPRTLSLRTPDPYKLSGVVGALATEAVLRGNIESGVHFAADVLDPWHTARTLRADPLVESWHGISRTEAIPSSRAEP